MSGFEIAGIVLATIPILTPIVQNTIQSLSTRRYDQQLQKLVRNLKTERVNLQNVVERLLDGLVPSSQIQAMINDPLGDLWQDEETALSIRGRLWDRAALESFEATMRSIKDSVDDLQKKLQAHSSSKAMLLNRARFQFADYDKSLAEIKAGIASLMVLTSDSISLESSRRIRSQGPFLTFLQTASQSLYRAIRSGLPCQSQCHHDVGLRLKHRKSVLNPHGNEDEIMQSLEYEVAISGASTTQEAMQSWRQITVKAAPATPATVATPTGPAATGTTMTKPSPQPPIRPTFPIRLKSALKSSKKTGATRSVGFGGPMTTSFSVSATESSATSTLVQTATLLSYSLPVGHATGLLADTSMALCKVVSQDQQPGAGGTLLDRPKRYTVSLLPTVTTGNAGQRSLISLRDVLEEKESFFLSFRDRLEIAVAVSSSVLQLHGSPWLSNDTLSSEDIYFFIDGNSKDYCNDGLTMLGEKPFLVRDKGPNMSTAASASSVATTSSTSPTPFRLVPPGVTASVLNCNKTLLSLGCLLLELVSNEKTPELLRCSPIPGTQDHVSLPQYLAAHRALVTYSLPSDNYRSAVSRCLQGGLHKPGRGLNTEDGCQDVYSGVVALLERDLENT
ncbi:hypothetical protein B0T16DRAFT_452536 [Cercophora newfieldiana]|uniref:DUF7580 domain-containing protein n=1 Tax=Cercophora newfieldiana TaxID=92897 RepID=A0AA40D0B1_9PEZI|nr:hypothetical protein B0T16DRAFT_452536 [Cercophora newfieldiana]